MGKVLWPTMYRDYNDEYDRRGGGDRDGGRRGGGAGGGGRERYSSGARVYVGNLPDDIEKEELRDFVCKHGSVIDIDIKYGKTSNHTSYAFVTFEDERDAEECIARRDGAKFMDGDRALRVRVEKAGRDRRRAERGPPRRSDYRVYVSGLPRNTSWQDLKDFFKSVADVGYANMERDVGVVEFHDRRDMEEVIRQMDGREFSNQYGSDKISVCDTPPEDYQGGGGNRGGYGGRGGGGGSGGDRGGRDRSVSPRARRSPSPARRARSRSRSVDNDTRRERPRSRSPAGRRESPARAGSRSRSRSAQRSPVRSRSRSPPRRSNSRD